MAFTPFKFEQCFVSDFIRDYDSGILIKPRLQRKLAWSHEDMTKFILFMIQHGGSTQNMYVNEQPNKKRCIFDGNNRGNAIVSFCETPLDFLPETIPTEFVFAEQVLKTIPLKWFVHGIEENGKPREFTYLRFANYSKDKVHVPDGNVKVSDTDYQTIWEDMTGTIKSWSFFSLKVSYVIYYNLSHEEMCSIYESINSGGKVLTKQELLASITAANVYTHEDIPKYYYVLKKAIEEYYDAMNKTECFQMNEPITDINTYELLLALQLVLSEKYSFMKLVTAKTEIDIVFTLYENKYGQFTERENIQEFIDLIMQSCAFLEDVLHRLCDTTLCVNKKQEKIKALHKNTTLVCLSMILYMSPSKEFMYTVLLIHHLCNNKKEELRRHKEEDDVLRNRREGGYVIPKLLKSIKEKNIDVVYTREKTKSILALCLTNQPTESRKPITTLEIIALTAFFQQNVPEKVKQLPHDIDHIVPFKFEGGHDKCRLGNKQIIHSAINKARGVKPITKKWIRDNDLTHQYYPSEEEYADVCQGEIVNEDAYNIMCEKREKMYVDIILQNCI